METCVILELGAELPAFVDQEAGAESNVTVLSEHVGEGAAAFAVRVLTWLEQAAARGMEQGCLVCGGEAGRERTSARGALLCALAETVTGSVRIATDGDRPDVGVLAHMLRVEHRVMHRAQRLRGPSVKDAVPQWTRRVA